MTIIVAEVWLIDTISIELRKNKRINDLILLFV